MNVPHIIYGVFYLHRLVYIGCTKRFPHRPNELVKSHDVLRSLKRFLKIRILSKAKDKRTGQQIETRMIQKHINNGAFLLNECPSVTVYGSSESSKEAWRKHWTRICCRRSPDALKLGRRNWTAENFDKAKEILTENSK